MDNELENKLSNNKFLNFYKTYKKSIYLIITFFIFFGVLIFFINQRIVQKNILISEKYIKAGLLLSSNKKNDAKILYEEIILSKNKFYSLLALNTIVEKKLITDNKKILNYFNILEDLNYSEEKEDLIKFKKALYLLQDSDSIEGKDILENLIKKDSKLKFLAQEIISN